MEKNNIISRAEEDFVEALYILSNSQEHVRSIDIASFLKQARPTVSRTLKKLLNIEYITRDKNSYLCLTEKGKETAEYIYDKHCFFRKWLLNAGIDEKTAEHECCLLEHNVCRESFIKLKKCYSQL